MANPDKSPGAADTRNAFDRAAEMRAADDKLKHLATQDHRPFLDALAYIKARHPRLHAIAEGRFEDDSALAAAGHDDPLGHMRD